MESIDETNISLFTECFYAGFFFTILVKILWCICIVLFSKYKNIEVRFVHLCVILQYCGFGYVANGLVQQMTINYTLEKVIGKKSNNFDWNLNKNELHITNNRHFTDPPESKLCLVVLDDKLICFLHFSSFCSFFIWWSLIVPQINKSIVGRATIVRVVTCFNWHINENSFSAWFTTWFHFGSIELDPFDK